MKYHNNQGLVLLICELIIGLFVGVISTIFATISVYALSFMWSIIGSCCSIAGLVFTIIGIVYVCQKEEKPLPLIGGITILK